MHAPLVALSLLCSMTSLQPWEPMPQAADSALALALDTLDMDRSMMDFDRHWATGVALLDSTVLEAIAHLDSIPGILAARVEALPGLELRPDTRTDGPPFPALLRMLEGADSAYAGAIAAAPGLSDTLAALLPAIWMDGEDPLDWDSVMSDWGLPVLDGEEMEAETLVALLEAREGPEPLPEGELLAAALALREVQWPEELPVTLPGVSGTTATFSFEGPVRYVVGGAGSNVYTADCPFELIVDTGGDDVYLLAAAGACGPAGRRVSVVVDLEGDDRYGAGGPVSLGCGLLGLGALVDLEGDDVYRAGNASLGAGLAGQGLLVDLSGDDLYEGGTFTQGAGCLGRGMLLDGSGDDVYRAELFGQGLGGPGGEGSLHDAGGSDCYLAGFTYPHDPLLPEDNQAMSQGFAMGLRPLVAGGIGLLADRGVGNDTYRAEVFGQGCAYYYGLGMLYDEGGQDCYAAAQYSQGSGIHLASGCLWDGSGDDSYFSRNGPAQGSAHDLSTGLLVDGGGNDWYCSDGGQALSLTNSAALFLDVSGADTYAVRGSGQGSAHWARGSSGASAFLDLADDDVYLGEGADSLRWTTTEYGAGIDMARETPGGLNPQDPVGSPEELGLDSLFSVAGEWGVGPNRERVRAHRDELASRGEEAVRYLLEEHLGTIDGLEVRAMEQVFEASRELSVELLSGLLASCDSLSPRELGNAMHFLGQAGDSLAAEAVAGFLAASGDTASVGLRVGALRALGEAGEERFYLSVVPFASDSSDRVRRQVAVALGELRAEEGRELLEAMAMERSVDVRSAAQRALELLDEAREEGEAGGDQRP